MNIDWFYFETQKLIRIVTLELLGIQYIKFYSFPLKIVGRARARERGEKRERESERQKEKETEGREGKKKRPSFGNRRREQEAKRRQPPQLPPRETASGSSSHKPLSYPAAS